MFRSGRSWFERRMGQEKEEEEEEGTDAVDAEERRDELSSSTAEM